MKSIKDRSQDIMRTVALMRVLCRRLTGPDESSRVNYYYFSGVYDDLLADGSSTRDSNKWRPYFNGGRPIGAKLLASLCEVPIWCDADLIYQNGPSNLWLAMWGDLRDIKKVVDIELKEWMNLNLVVTNFEEKLLFSQKNHDFLGVSYLAKAVALYRLIREIEEIFPLGLDCVGSRRCLRVCLGDAQVHRDLDSFGILQAVNTELSMWTVT